MYIHVHIHTVRIANITGLIIFHHEYMCAFRFLHTYIVAMTTFSHSFSVIYIAVFRVLNKLRMYFVENGVKEVFASQ